MEARISSRERSRLDDMIIFLRERKELGGCEVVVVGVAVFVVAAEKVMEVVDAEGGICWKKCFGDGGVGRDGRYEWAWGVGGGREGRRRRGDSCPIKGGDKKRRS